MTIQLRPATNSDVMLFYDLVCNPKVRQMSFDQSDIPLSTHMKWFFEVIKTESLYVVEKNRKAVGQVRISKFGEVDITISPLYNGNGYGVVALTLIKQTPLIAHIKLENVASIKTFERAGFVFRGNVEYKGHKCLEYSKQ